MIRQFFILTCFVSLTACNKNTGNETKNAETAYAAKTISIQDTTPVVIDTLVDTGNYKLHFNIIKGTGIPILFENGAGDNCSVWDTIFMPIAKITGTTLIRYDRAGFGKSTLDTLNRNIPKHGIRSGLADLETALRKLGYSKEIMLVSHSYGGNLTTLYSEKYPNLVKSIVLVDVPHNFHNKYVEEEVKEFEKELNDLKKNNPGFYYLVTNFLETTKFMSSHSMPKNIPVVDFINGISFQENEEKTEYWKECHQQFVNEHPKSTGVTANGCEHYIWLDNPNLVVLTIVKSFAEIADEKQRTTILENALNYSIVSSNIKTTDMQEEN